MKTWITGATLVTEEGVKEADLLFDQKILAIGGDFSQEDAQKVEGKGKWILPGGVDIHTHMTLDVGIAQVVDDFVSGGAAAVCGGTTTIVDHVGFAPKNAPLSHSPKSYLEKNLGKSTIDFALHGVFQHLQENTLQELEELVSQGLRSYKLYMTYDYRMKDEEILIILKKMKELGALAYFHGENHQMIQDLRQEFLEKGLIAPKYHPLSRPPHSEGEAITRLIRLAKEAGNAPIYVVHLSTKEGLEAIKQGRKEGNPHIYAETCPQYLMFTDEVYENPQEGLKYIMSPPLRKPQDVQALWQGLEEGHIQTLATDHCPFHFATQKQMGKDDFTKCPNGAGGVAERFPVFLAEAVYGRNWSLPQFVEVISTAPAKIAGLYPQKGVISLGSDSDLIVIDPYITETVDIAKLHGNSDYSLYQGKKQAVIHSVYQRGRKTMENNVFLGDPSWGRYLGGLK